MIPTWRRYALTRACIGLYCYPFLRIITFRADEGWCLTGAARVYRGELPYRDFFEIVGPGTFYWIALFFKLLGENWLATRVCVAVTGIATALCIYFLTRQLRQGLGIAVLLLCAAIAFPTWPAINHHSAANLFAITTFALYMLWLRVPYATTLCLTGLFAGLTLVTMIQKGVLVSLAVVLLLTFRRNNTVRMAPILEFLAGMTVTVSVTVVYFARTGALSDLLYATLTWPLRNYSQVGFVPYGFGFGDRLWRDYSSLSASFHPWIGLLAACCLSLPFVIVLLLPLFLLFFIIYFKKGAFTSKTRPYWAFGSALWLSEAHRPDMIHLAMGCPILIILCFYFAVSIRSQVLDRLRQVVIFTSATMAGTNLLICIAAQTRLVTPIGTTLAFARNPVIDFTNSHVMPRQTLFVYPYAPIYYFLSGASNPTRYSYLVYGHHSQAQMIEATSFLDRDLTRYVIWDTSFDIQMAQGALPGYRPPLDAARVIEPYLNQHYREIGSANAIKFMERMQK